MPKEALLDSRYRVLRTIGSGGMGVVYLVADTRKENNIIALKTCSMANDISAADEFKSEFRSIRGVSHPHIPEVYDFGSLPNHNDSLYFTTEFIDGQPLDRLQSEWTPEQLREILVGLCRALAFLHSRSLLHRDIKPDNVLGKLDDDGSLSLLKLVDFGLAASSNEQKGELSGTLDYLAPEVVRGGSHTGSSDLYSLGLLLYRLATGKLPFDDHDPMAAAKLRAKQEVPSPLRYRPTLPVGLADVISSMVRLKEKDRPQSPRHVIALLNEREGTDYPYETDESSRAYIRSATLVTNREARQLLSMTKGTLKQGHTPRSIFLRGLPGMGRSSLINEFQSELTLSGISCRIVKSDSDLPTANDYPKAILIPKAEEIDTKKLCGAKRDLSGVAVLWILGGRQLPDACTESFEAFKTLELKPLDQAGVEEFIRTTFPENSFPENLCSRLFSETLGIPSALQALLKSLQDSGLLRIGLFGWELLPGKWPQEAHPDVAEYIDEILGQSSERLRKEIELLSCSVISLPITVLSKALEQLGESGEKGFEQNCLIAEEDGNRFIRFAAARNCVAARVDEETEKSRHRLLRSVWQETRDCDTDLREREILYHDFKGESWETDGVKAAQVLEKAVDSGLLDWCRNLLNWCVSQKLPDDLKTPVHVALSRIEYIEGNLSRSSSLLGEVLENGSTEITAENLPLLARYANLEEKLGHTDLAERILNQALDALTPDLSSAFGSVYGTLAWIAFKQGDQEKAAKLAEEGLARVPFDAADPGFALLLNTFATLAFYKGDSETAGAYWQRCMEVSQKLGDKKNIANMYNNLGVLAAQGGDRTKARQLWEECAKIASEIHDTHRLAGIYNNLGVDALETGQLREAEEYYLRSLTLFRRMQGPREQVELLSNLGELSYYRADYTRAQAFFRESLDLAATLGDKESQIEPMVYLGKLLIALNHVEQAEQTLSSAKQIAHETGVKKGEGQALEGLAMIYARDGMTKQVIEALKQAHELMPNEVDPLASIHLNLTECRLYAEKGDLEAAKTALENARQVADIKWDPYTAARTETYGLLFAKERSEEKQLQLTLRKLNIFPDFLWGLHWARARQNVSANAIKQALDEFGKGVAVLKAIASRLPESDRDSYLNSPLVLEFKSEALQARKLLKAD